MSAPSLFAATVDADGYESEPREIRTPFAPELAARKKLGVGDDWKWYGFKRIDDEIVLVEGAVPIGIKKDGAPKWPAVKDCQKVYVTKQQVEEAETQYETTTGKCVRCGGGGYVFSGWAHDKGYKYQDCPRCSAKAGAA